MTGRCVLRNRRQGSRHAPGSPGTVDDGALTATLRVPTVQFREPLVEAKLAAPYLRAAVLQRDALVRELLRTNAGLVTMVAPPGYGKSTSLALWRARERRPVAWVTCDAADADPIRFLSYVGLAIERALDLATPIFDGVPLNAESALSFAVPRLTSALHAARQAMVLMLDDVHHVAGHAIGRRAVDDRRLPAGRGHGRGRGPHRRRAARRAPPRERQAGRDRCRRPRLRRAGVRDAGGPRRARAARGRGPRAPRPDRGLAGRRVPRRPPGPAHRRGGKRRQQSASPGGTPTSATTSTPSSSTTLTPRVRAFLLRTAILDRMSADLCDAVVEGKGSDRILRDLASTNQLVVPLDTEGGWFRYHTLLREHLLAKLERDRGASTAAHRRAAAWFAASGMPELAVDHLFAAGDPDAAAAQACAVVPRLFREGREATFARWLAMLDDDGLRRQPFLAVLGAWMHTILGRPADAERHGRPVPHRGVRRRAPAGRRALRGSPGLGAGPHGPRRAGRRGRTMRETPSPAAPRSAPGDRSRWRCWARS